MKPTGLEMLRGVQALLVEQVLPALSAPHLRGQVGMAIGMIAAAAAELDDAPALYPEERARARAMARRALPLVQARSPDEPLLRDLAALADEHEAASPQRVTVLEAESARLLDLLDRLIAFCDGRNEHDIELAALGAALDAELHARLDRRLAWGGGVR